MPTCASLIIPQPGPLREESVMAGMKEKMMFEVRKYIKEECNESGWPKSNLTRSEVDGMKELKEKIKRKEIVVFKSDKSGKMTVDSMENYSEAISVHTEGDTEIDERRVEKIEKNANDYLKVLNRIFNVGAAWNQQRRVAEASTSTNVPPPAFYGLRKDHKVVPEERKEKGPPVRPICSAREAPNSRLSNFASRVLNSAADLIEDHHEVRSSEEMRASFERFNTEVSEADRRKCKIISTDIKALYPSMRIKTAKVAVKEMILRSKQKIQNVDKWELVKMAAVVLSEEEIEEDSLQEVVPHRLSGRKVTVSCLRSSENDARCWSVPGSQPDEDQVLLLVALVMSHCVEVIMSNHTYKLGDKIFLQKDGGPIGLEATGAISRAYMLYYDRLYLKAVKEAGIRMLLYDRYIDDTQQAAVDDSDSEDEEIMGARLKAIGNNVIEGLEVEEDMPSRHIDKKLPILDMKVHISEGFIVYEHYEKEVSTKLVIAERSAHSAGSKRSVHISELVRRMLNSSRRLDWSASVAPVLEEYMRRMMAGGYSEKYRENVLRNALAVYDSKLKEDVEGKVPLNRPRGYKKAERRKEKRMKKRNWGTKGGHIAPIIVPSTPGGELARRLREVAEREAIPGLRFKIAERGGKTVGGQLQRPNPTESPGCQKEDCQVCRQPGGGGGRCRKTNVTYKYRCKECGATYVGETSRNLYTRAGEHQHKFEKNKINSFLHTHQEEDHQGDPPEFSISVVGSYRDPLSRQVAEAVQISNCEEKLLNSKAEFRQPPIVRGRREVNVGV